MQTVEDKLTILRRKIDYVEINPSPYGFIELRQCVTEILAQLKAEIHPASDRDKETAWVRS